MVQNMISPQKWRNIWNSSLFWTYAHWWSRSICPKPWNPYIFFSRVFTCQTNCQQMKEWSDKTNSKSMILPIQEYVTEQWQAILVNCCLCVCTPCLYKVALVPRKHGISSKWYKIVHLLHIMRFFGTFYCKIAHIMQQNKTFIYFLNQHEISVY